MLPFWPIHPPASAIHPLNARGDNEMTKTATTATTATTRCGTRMMNDEGLDDENEDEDDEDNEEEKDEDDGQQTH